MNTTENLSLNLATVRAQWDMRQAVEACLAHGVTAISPWRDQVQKIGLAEAEKLVRDNGLRVTGLCRGGMFPAADAAGRKAAVEDNKRAIEEAARLHADCLVMVVGGLPAGSRDIRSVREMVAEGMRQILDDSRAAGVKLAVEPLHPMYAADRACVNTLEQALDLCELLGPDVGVAIDAYHVWWDPKLAGQIARAGAGHRIFAHHICDWLVPTRELLMDRGMMGDGVVDLKGLRRAIEQAGYHGPQEVEILSSHWGSRPGEEVLRTVIERYNSVCLP